MADFNVEVIFLAAGCFLAGLSIALAYVWGQRHGWHSHDSVARTAYRQWVETLNSCAPDDDDEEVEEGEEWKRGRNQD